MELRGLGIEVIFILKLLSKLADEDQVIKEDRYLSYYQTFLLWHSFEINDNFVLLYKISKNNRDDKVIMKYKSGMRWRKWVEGLIIVNKRRQDSKEENALWNYDLGSLWNLKEGHDFFSNNSRCLIVTVISR